MPGLIGVDWGTSMFRGFFIRDGTLVDCRHTAAGITRVTGGDFAGTLMAQLGDWLADAPDTPVLLAGMVGSRHGWVEVPCVPCPARPAGLTRLHRLPLGQGRHVHLVPGLGTTGPTGVHDVMRGEETQIAGTVPRAATRATPNGTNGDRTNGDRTNGDRTNGDRTNGDRTNGDRTNRHLLCLPGTHSKWVRMAGARVDGFATSVTGEMFAILSGQGTIGALMADLPSDRATHDPAAFAQGLRRAREAGGLLHHLFGVRAEGLSGTLPPAGLRSYLSGILIGSEVAAMTEGAMMEGVGPEGVGPEDMGPEDMGPAPVTIVGAGDLGALYATALRQCGHGVSMVDGVTAAWRGLWRIAGQAGLLRDGTA